MTNLTSCILLQAALSKQFCVQGIPVLVLIDAESGKVITSSGRKCVVSDPDGKEFPWIPEPLSSILFNGHLLRGSEEVDSKLALTGMVKGLYFSAHWVCILNKKVFLSSLFHILAAAQMAKLHLFICNLYETKMTLLVPFISYHPKINSSFFNFEIFTFRC